MLKKINILLITGAMISVLFGFILNPGKKNSVQSGNVTGTEIGNLAPEIKLKNPKDSLITLSSLRGKIVLLDFWAAWCGPCRMENPNIVAVYNKYKGAKFRNAKGGFTVYNVSLDVDKQKWIAAIKKDNLAWPYHVSDLKYWQSEAAQRYGIGSIPASFLLDARGVIIGKNLRGAALEEAIKKLLEKK